MVTRIVHQTVTHCPHCKRPVERDKDGRWYCPDGCDFEPDGDSRRAFTLVELLVVVAVIGVIIGITLPVLAGVRETARRVKCQANQRSIAVAVFAATDDRRGVPLSESSIIGNASPVFVERLGIAGVLVCPADRLFAPTHGGSFIYLPFGYAMNGAATMNAAMARRMNVAITTDSSPCHRAPVVNTSYADGSVRAMNDGSTFNPRH